MPFQLHIRQNIEATAEHFARSEVRDYDAATVRVGSAPDAECRIEASGFSPEHFILERSGQRFGQVLIAHPGSVTYVNGTPVEDRCVLHSGDEIRVGHWTLTFQRLYSNARRSRRFGYLSLAAKILVAAIMISELLLVTVLPRRLHQATLWEHEITRQRIATLLDQLVRDNAKAVETDPLAVALRKSVDRELQDRLSYLNEYNQVLSGAQNRRLFEELTDFAGIVGTPSAATLLSAPPAVDVDAGIRALLHRQEEGDTAHE